MPTVNVYSTQTLSLTLPEDDALKKFVADKLSGPSRQLKPAEISVRIISVTDQSSMIGDLEIEITAHQYPERVKRSDQIATEVANYLQERFKEFSKVRAWLNLVELGHTDVDY